MYIWDIERALKEFGIPFEFSNITDPTAFGITWGIQDWLQQNINNSENNNNKVTNHTDIPSIEWITRYSSSPKVSSQVSFVLH